MSDQNKESDKDSISIELKQFSMRSASMSRQSDEILQAQTQTAPQFVHMRKESLPAPFPQENHTNNIPSTSVTVMPEEPGNSDLFHDPDQSLAANKKSRKSKLYRPYPYLETKLQNIHGWAKNPIVDPRSQFIKRWNKLFDISSLVAIFIDPFFFFLLSVEKTNKCMVLNWSVGIAIAVVRSITDFIYLLHMLIKFILPYVGSDWTDVEEHRKIALHYLCGHFKFDLFLVLPLPQVLNLVVIPKFIRPSAEYYSKYTLPTINLLQLLQYIPRTFRFLPLPGGQSASGFIFESAWTNLIVNLLMFVLAGHVVGSAWYLFGFLRVRQCLLDTCGSFNKTLCSCLIVCGTGGDIDNFSQQFRQQWRDYEKSSNCLDSTSHQFSYGIYQLVVPLTTKDSVITRYIYSLFWGFQQISTLAGNQMPSYFVWEVLFTMAIVGIGLLLFALLIGNVQNILQVPEKRRLEMQQKKHDMEQWMCNMELSNDLRERVREAEKLSWRTTRGLNEEELLLNLPDKLQKEIRRQLYSRLLDEVKILNSLDDRIFFDAIIEKLRRQMYPKGSLLICNGDPIDKVVFIVRGMLESREYDSRIGHINSLMYGDVFGEELIARCIEQHSLGPYKEGGKNRYQGLCLISAKTIRCATNVDMFVLRADDLDQVISVSGVLCNPDVQMAVRCELPYWRERAANIIQVAWRNRKRNLIKQQNTK